VLGRIATIDPKSKTVVAILRNYNRGATGLGNVATELLRELVE